jgi:outer membrane protein, heavy metal efflux system
MISIALLSCLVGSPGWAQSPVPSPLTYDKALELASSTNLAVAAARRQRAVREAAVQTARLSPNPELSTEFTRDTPHETLNFDLPIEFGGKRARRIDLAKEQLSLADVDVQVQLRLVRRELRSAFYSLLAADERIRLADSLQDVARRFRDVAQGRFEAGAAPRLEVLQADLGVARAETDVDLARSLRTSAQATLNGILNLPVQRTLTVSGTMDDKTIETSYESALALAIANNTDLLALDRQIAIEARRLDLLRAERTPTPVFSFGAVFNAPGEFAAGPRAGFSIGLPFFNRNQGEIAGSIAVTSQLRAQRDATARVIESAVFAAVTRISAEHRRVDAYRQRLLPTATELSTLSEESYRAGRTSVLGAIEALRAVRELSREALQTTLDLQILFAELEALLGTSLP